MVGIIPNTNDQFTWSHGYEKVYQSNNQVKMGRVVNVKRKNHLALTYDVKLFDSGDLIVTGCKLATSEAGFNGNGVSQPLNEGTPVIIAFKNGMLQDGLILGCFHSEGDYKNYYQEGALQKPGETLKGSEFNQPDGHPNRITQEDSYFHTMGGKTITSQYDSPEYHGLTEDRIKSQPMPSSIHMRNQGGDSVTYTMGANILYSDGNVINVSAGDREEKTTKLLRFAGMHARRADLIEGITVKPTSEEQAVQKAEADTIIPIVQKISSNASKPDAISDSYRAAQERKLAELYTSAAKAQNQLTAARQTEASSLQSQFGSELGSNPPDGKLATPNYKPKEEKARVDPNNSGKRESTDVNGQPTINNLLVVLHETVSTADSALNAFSNPSTEASYHAIIRRDGSITYLVPPNQRAFGAANSDFNGESVKLSTTAQASVNNFAYHISLESPDDGRGNTSTHSGYTEGQYQSLAWLVSRTGVADDRITTHAAVDNTGERSDPRSFDRAKFNQLLRAYPKTRQLEFGAGIN